MFFIEFLEDFHIRLSVGTIIKELPIKENIRRLTYGSGIRPFRGQIDFIGANGSPPIT
jgi:hypothetical protein